MNSPRTMPSSWRLEGAVAIMAEQCQARGHGGAVAAAAPTAALIGAQMMRSGGNAYDAAVAAALAETVLLPPKCGLAGDLVALAWPAHDEAPSALLAIGGAPAGLAVVAASRQLHATGPSSVGVPAAPAGYLELARRGRLPLAQLAEPAIELARNGFCWSRICSSLAEESAALVERYNPLGTRYYPSGEVIAPGTVVKLPGLARTLQSFVADPDAFLMGEVGDAIVECVRNHGGVLTREDLRRSSAAQWSPVARSRLGNQPLFATPAPTHGAALLRAVATLDKRSSNLVVAVHDSVGVTLDWQRKELADPSGTSMVSAVDADGTMVTIVHSNSYPRFGSGLIVPEFDLILANRAGRGFSSTPGHPNFPVPGRRPATTLHAWATIAPDGRRLQGATPGGANQMPWNAQTLARLLEGEADIGRLIAAPRWEFEPAEGRVVLEEGFEPAQILALRARCQRVDEVGRWALHSAMQILAMDRERGVYSASADPRTVGAALAF